MSRSGLVERPLWMWAGRRGGLTEGSASQVDPCRAGDAKPQAGDQKGGHVLCAARVGQEGRMMSVDRHSQPLRRLSGIGCELMEAYSAWPISHTAPRKADSKYILKEKPMS